MVELPQNCSFWADAPAGAKPKIAAAVNQHLSMPFPLFALTSVSLLASLNRILPNSVPRLTLVFTAENPK